MVYRILIAGLFFSCSLFGQDTLQIVGGERMVVVIKSFDNKTITYYEYDDDQQILMTESMGNVLMMAKAKSKKLIWQEEQAGLKKRVLNGIYLEGIGGVGIGNLSYDILAKISRKNYLGIRLGVVMLASNRYAGLYEIEVLSRMKKGYFKGGIGTVVSEHNDVYGMLLDFGYRFMPKTKGMFFQVSITPTFQRFRTNVVPFAIATGIAF